MADLLGSKHFPKDTDDGMKTTTITMSKRNAETPQQIFDDHIWSSS